MVRESLRRVLPKNKVEAPTLNVLVFQGSALQCEYKAKIDRPVRVRIGKSENIELPIPFSMFPNDIVLFSADKWGAKVHLDPRIDGFVSDGQRFGDVRDFIAPRGALKELASVLEPLEVPIPLGSRGTLEIAGYTIVFRVEKRRPAPAKVKIQGAPKAPFGLPESNSWMERGGFFLGFVSTVLVVIPLVQWFNKAPVQEFTSIKDLSPFLAAEIVHPDHFQILPWVFGPEFRSQQVVSHSLQWVDELRRKWQAEDLGQRYTTSLPSLQGFSNPENVHERRGQWQRAFDSEWKRISEKRETAAPGTFFKGQTAYSPMSVAVSGGERGSLSERVRARLEKLDRTQEAVISLIETEHAYMKEHFAKMDAEIKEIFDPPKEPGLFFRLAEKAFSTEKENYQAAESFAALAREKQKAKSSGSTIESDDDAESLVWSPTSLAVPHVLSLASLPLVSGSEGELVKNAKLSLGKIAPPPVPKPQPKIDMREVENYVRGRSAEVKGCYDVALSRDPRMGGTVTWRWTVAENGRISRSVIAGSTIKDKQFLNCLDRKIRGWTLPRPQNGAITISFPFRFVVRENMDTLERIAR